MVTSEANSGCVMSCGLITRMSSSGFDTLPSGGERSTFSRRAFMSTMTAVLASAAVGASLANPAPAAAAVSWGHPFTFRSGRSRGFTGVYPKHAGIDYTPGIRTPIHAVADGIIVISGVTGNNGAFGESIWINHSDGFRTIYAHMLENTRVPTGRVRRGDQIGLVGDTGHSFGAHLHIELHKNNRAIDPHDYVHFAPLAGTTPQPEEPEVPEEPEETIDMFLLMAQDTTQTPAIRWAVVAPGFWYVTNEKTTADGLSLRAGAQINVTWAEWDAAYRAAVSSGFVPASGQTSRTL